VTRLLIYQPSLATIAAEIDQIGPDLEVLVMDPAGAITLAGETIAIDAARIDSAMPGTS